MIKRSDTITGDDIKGIGEAGMIAIYNILYGSYETDFSSNIHEIRGHGFKLF